MPSSTVVSPIPAGAGRTVSISWPRQLELFIANNAVLDTKMDLRQGGVVSANGAGATYTLGGAGSGLESSASYNGRETYQLSGGGAGNANFSMAELNDMAFHPRLGALGQCAFDPSLCDDHLVTRIIAIGAFGFGATLSDSGLYVAQGNSLHRRVVDAAAGALVGGIGFAPADVANTRMRAVSRVNNVGALNTLFTTPVGFNATGIDHAYEIRIIGATQTADASLKMYIDNVLIYSDNWGAGGSGLLPVTNGIDNRLGFMPMVACSQGCGMQLYKVIFIQATNEAMAVA